MGTPKLPARPLSAEDSLFFKTYARYIAFLRRHATHAARFLFRIVIPPHESVMLENAWMNYKDNHYVCSRGTSKTFTIGSLNAPLTAMLFKNVRNLVASASMFRGGKMILKDSERLLRGTLASQKRGAQWPIFSIAHPKPIRREPDMWNIEFKSASFVFTIPTNNEEAARGTRATTISFDERNNFDQETLEVVFSPFSVVGTDFENPALGAAKNQTFNVGTIDYSFRDWAKEIRVIEDLLHIQYRIQRAMMSGDWDTYDSLMAQHGAKMATFSASMVRYDYTDLLIPTHVNGYKVHYPGAREGKDIKWDDRDQKHYIYTYPLDKTKIETKLDQGLADAESWAAEHRNMFIFASGSVYSPKLVEKVTGPIFSVPEEKKHGWDAQKEGGHYVSPVLYECSDPCVLGVDVARTAAQSAFVVIRIGSAPTSMFPNDPSDYSLKSHVGKSSWSNVIWAEQHQHMTAADTADLIRRLKDRYNIVNTFTISGLVMDARGGGTYVRDDLANPSPPVDPTTGLPVPSWKPPQKIYDPDDNEFKTLKIDTEAWGGLKLLVTSEAINQELVSFSRAQMETGRLYIAPYDSRKSRAVGNERLLPGYLGARVLHHQLLRIQAQPTASGKSVKYVMPGDASKLENQKDMLMAFLYACYALRQVHHLSVTQVTKPPPSAAAMVISIPRRK